MAIKPLRTKVLVAENVQDVTTESGLFLGNVKGMGDTPTATVLEIGPDVDMVKVGDVVMLNWGKASIVRDGNVQRVIIEQEEITVIIENNS